MEISIKYQLITTLISLVMGVFIGLIYEFFKILRILFGLEFNNKIAEKIEKIRLPLIKKLEIKKEIGRIKRYVLYFLLDLSFFIFITPIMMIYLYVVSNGIVRWYIVLGVFLGFILYRVTLNKLLGILFDYAAMLLKIIIASIVYLIKLPFKILIKKIAVANNKRKNKKLKRKEQREKLNFQKNKQILCAYGKK